VALQPCGDRPPFFCVHGVGGNELAFAELARHFPATRPFYAVTTRPRPLGEAPRRVEGLAAEYVAAVRGVQPAGPYFLGGFSFGGSVALEMAQQLRDRGEEVGLLAILDHTPPPLRYRRVTWSWPLPAEFCLNAGRWFLEDVWKAGRGRRLAALRGHLRRAARQAASLLRPGPGNGRTDTEEVFGSERLPEEFRRLVEELYQALREYRPRPYPGRVTLFRARTRPLFRLHGPDLGWKGLARGGLEVVAVPGNHETILKGPNARVIARGLLERLAGIPSPERTLALATHLDYPISWGE
jgi:thioesterase domain-containing protein